MHETYISNSNNSESIQAISLQEQKWELFLFVDNIGSNLL